MSTPFPIYHYLFVNFISQLEQRGLETDRGVSLATEAGSRLEQPECSGCSSHRMKKTLDLKNPYAVNDSRLFQCTGLKTQETQMKI